MTAVTLLADTGKAAALLLCATVLQVTILSTVEVAGGTPDLVLVTLVAVALVRGSAFGAAAGFWAGLLVDTANLATLGVTSLLLTLAGYWTGRYGETTGRDRTHAPLVAVAVVTVLYALGALVLHFILGNPVSTRAVLVESLLPQVAFNILLTLPVFALARRLLPRIERPERAREVRLLG